jgi:hypothetical protein
MRLLLAFLVLPLLAVAQQVAPNPQTVRIDVAPQPMKPPPVTLQQALQIAEKYIAENKIEIGRYWLQEVKWVLPEGATMKESHWLFFWNNLGTGRGDYVEIEVDMNRHPLRRPSM